MDVALVILHGLFFAPVLFRVIRGLQSGAADRTDLAASPARVAARVRAVLFIHGAGLAVLYGGLGFALLTGGVPRAVTLQGALGALVLVSADALMAWAFLVFRSWRILPKLDLVHELCSSGPYALVRHPMYLAVDLLALGSALWVPTPPVIAGALLLILGGDLRARAEEKLLLGAFGDGYRWYLQRVRRIVPGVY